MPGSRTRAEIVSVAAAGTGTGGVTGGAAVPVRDALSLRSAFASRARFPLRTVDVEADALFKLKLLHHRPAVTVARSHPRVTPFGLILV